MDAKNHESKRTRISHVTVMDLPRVIMVEILSRLPIKLIFRCKTVCKLWHHHLTSNPFLIGSCNGFILFSEGHSNLSLLELKADYDYHSLPGNRPILLSRRFHLPPLESLMFLVGSCNGFICLLNRDTCDENHSIYINNPLLGEYFKVKLPEMEKSVWDVAYGFRFSEASHQYKVLRLVVRKVEVSIEVYTLGVDEKWRNTGQVPFPVWDHAWSRFDKAYVNGALHWIDLEKNDSIYSFDIGTEKLKSLPPPPGLKIPSWPLTLAELGNCLCLTDNMYRQHVNINIWWMKEYGIAESWSKDTILVNIIPPGMNTSNFEMILIWKDGEILIQSGTILASYNPIKKKYRKLDVYGNITAATRYVPSFYSLKTVMGESFQVSNAYPKTEIV